MNSKIREVQHNDYGIIYDLIKSAFKDIQESDHREEHLVKSLQKSKDFIPQLSLAAENDNNMLVGYILLTKLKIISEKRSIVSLGVAPLAVLPEFQKQGIGWMLLEEAHKRAARLGYGSVVLIGHKEYYPRFGYRKESDFGIKFPFAVPQECCMAKELYPNALKGVHGTVRYPDEFFNV